MTNGLFAWIRKTSFTTFLIYWISGIFAFTMIYWISSLWLPMLVVGAETVTFTFAGFIESLSASLLIATIFGMGEISSKALIYWILVYSQFIFSAVLVLILIDKLLQKYVFPMYHVHHTQDRKINTMTMTMSIFRNDISRLKSEFKAKTKHHVNIREIESIIDGLYITFLDIDKMFSSKNMHRHHIDSKQYNIIIHNIDDSLHTLSKFIDFLEGHKIEWKDKNIKFWTEYILDTAEKIILHFDDVKTSNHRLIIAVENIRDHVQVMREKL